MCTALPEPHWTLQTGTACTAPCVPLAVLADQLVPAGSSSPRLPRSILLLVCTPLPAPALHVHLHRATELPSLGRQLCEGDVSSSSAGCVLPLAWGREQRCRARAAVSTTRADLCILPSLPVAAGLFSPSVSLHSSCEPCADQAKRQ